MEFIEIIKQHDLEEAYKILKELEPELFKENFLKSIDHELLKKTINCSDSNRLVN